MKLFLAGTCTRKNLLSTIEDCHYILESYYTFAEWQIPLIKKSKMFLLDSGAYTFIAQRNKQFKENDVNWEEYVNKYADFINKYDIKYFFELDIDSLVGIKEVERLRRILETKTGKKCIPVWHVSRGKDYFVKMCQEYDYVAFGGILTDGVSNKLILKYLPWFAKTAHKYGTQIHALGLTCRGIEKYGVDSADSTSWLSAGRFGQLHQFDGTAMKTIGKNKENTRIKDHRIADKHNLQEWIKYQRYLER